ncbi:VCBS repeat-containing protein [Cohnella sp. LGH]|uniref:FG-GAP repeat domain-containing protein n=1 Tax=Cohnella sp. LGH TaxID=1619153 RepID=UPI001ADA8DA7|nr:VCBS repeat-containing protein [Cohnella sp. LGH]QTH42816.1 VCBS repeat-containing protein [Cohnella sp. LGH]
MMKGWSKFVLFVSLVAMGGLMFAGSAGASVKMVGMNYLTWFDEDYDWYKAWDPDSLVLTFDNGGKWRGFYKKGGQAFGAAPRTNPHGAMTGWDGSGWADSYNGGESETGVLRSNTFTIGTGMISYKIAGWSGSDGSRNLNHVYIRRASDNAILHTGNPPLSNSFSQVQWDGSAYNGTLAYLEVVDNDANGGYAWIGIDSFVSGSFALNFDDGTWGSSQPVDFNTAFGSPRRVPHGSMSGWDGTYWADSYNGGEAAIGNMRSINFTIRNNLITFKIAGWSGVDGSRNLNHVYIRRTSDDAILFTANPPLSDSFQQVQWDGSAYNGVQAYLDVVDNDNNNTYAWIAIDSFVHDVNTNTVEPVEGFYTSDDVTVMQNHAATLRDMGVDFIESDLTNNMNWGPAHPQTQFQTDPIYEAGLLAFNTFASVSDAPKGMFMAAITTWDDNYGTQRLITKNYGSGGTPYMYYPWIPSNSGDLFLQKISRIYNDIAQYPDKYLNYEGKPLLQFYVSGSGTILDENDVDQTPDGKLPDTWNPVVPNTGGKTIRELFTIRWVGALMAGSGNPKFVPATGDTLKAYNGHWSLCDATNQTWAARKSGWGDTPESVRVTPNADGSVGRENGNTYKAQWNRLLDVDPLFAMISSWNGFSTSGDERDAEHSATIEPTVNYFTDTYKVMTENYISHFKRERMDIGLYDTTARDMFLNNRSADDYDGYAFDFGFETKYAMDRGSGVEALSGDFNGDGKSDFALRNIADGTVAIRYSPYFTVESSGSMPAEKVATLQAGARYKSFAGDFNGDGTTDIGFYDSTVGNFIIRYNDGNANFTTSYTWAWSLSDSYQYASADVNGDGRYDIVYRDPATGTVHLALAKTDGLQTKPTATYSHSWTSGSGYQLFTGEANGDAYGDIGLRATGTGVFYMRKNLNTQTSGAWNFGDEKSYTYKTGAQYLPITGDFR